MHFTFVQNHTETTCKRLYELASKNNPKKKMVLSNSTYSLWETKVTSSKDYLMTLQIMNPNVFYKYTI